MNEEARLPKEATLATRSLSESVPTPYVETGVVLILAVAGLQEGARSTLHRVRKSHYY